MIERMDIVYLVIKLRDLLGRVLWEKYMVQLSEFVGALLEAFPDFPEKTLRAAIRHLRLEGDGSTDAPVWCSLLILERWLRCAAVWSVRLTFATRAPQGFPLKRWYVRTRWRHASLSYPLG